MGAAADCELIRAGLLGQPVNSLTTFAFVLSGMWLVRRPANRWIGAGLAAAGIGSLLFHGPMPAWSEWAHDLTLAWLIAMIAGLETRWEPWSRLPALAGLGALFAVLPVTADPVAVALAVVAAASIMSRRRQGLRSLAPLGLMAGAAVLGRLGATGGPLCDPSSTLQMHGLWHIGAAIGVAWWAETSTRLPV